MIAVVEQNRSAVADLCRKHGVRTFEVFGSAVAGTFDAERSDLDFLVDFLPMPPSAHSRAYFGLWFALEDLFGRDVDLVEAPAVTNPFFLKSINRSRHVLYAA